MIFLFSLLLINLTDSLPPLPSPFEIDISRIPIVTPHHNRFALGFIAGGIQTGQVQASLAHHALFLNGEGSCSNNNSYVGLQKIDGWLGFGGLSKIGMISPGIHFFKKTFKTRYEVFKPFLSMALPFSGGNLLFDAEYHQGDNENFAFREGKLALNALFTGKEIDYSIATDYERREGEYGQYLVTLFLAPRVHGFSGNIGLAPEFTLKADKIHPGIIYKLNIRDFEFSGRLSRGPEFEFFDDIFRTDLPTLVGSVKGESESRISTQERLTLGFGKHRLTWSIGYHDWRSRRSVRADWQMIYLTDVKELLTELVWEEGVTFLKNRLHLKYQQVDKPIPFLAEYSIEDKCLVSPVKSLSFQVSSSYLPQREGLEVSLNDVIIFSAGVTWQAGRFKLLGQLDNITNAGDAFYDGINLEGRQWGIGAEVGL